MELRAHEQHALQVIKEQKVNNDQLVVQRDSTINLVSKLTYKNPCLTKVVDEACRTIPELDIPEAEPVDVRVRKLVAECTMYAQIWLRFS